MTDVDRLRSEAEVASGFGTREQVDPAEWLPEGLTVGDVIRVEAPGHIETFDGTVRGFTKHGQHLGCPLVHSVDVPVDGPGGYVNIREPEYAGVVDDAE